MLILAYTVDAGDGSIVETLSSDMVDLQDTLK